MRTLFIGNSHTYFNDMPAIFRDLCRARGMDMEVTMLATPNMGLDFHAASEEARFNILFGDYDYIILQHCAHPMGDLEVMDRAAGELLAMIRTTKAIPVFYMTWTKKGDEASQADMAAVYERLGRKYGVKVAPVGLRWQEARLMHPETEYYFADGAHASPAGSALAASVILETIISESIQDSPSIP